MAETNVDISSEKSLVIDGVLTRNVGRKFGRPSDYVELHIYDISDNLLYSEDNFRDFTSPSNQTGELSSELNMDPVEVLRNRGYTSGKYKLSFNIQRKKIVNFPL